MYTRDGETFGHLPLMPGDGLNIHCAVALDGGDLFVTGGVNQVWFTPSFKTFLFHSDTMEWEELQGAMYI